jgi:hypothetical protein
LVAIISAGAGDRAMPSSPRDRAVSPALAAATHHPVNKSRQQLEWVRKMVVNILSQHSMDQPNSSICRVLLRRLSLSIDSDGSFTPWRVASPGGSCSTVLSQLTGISVGVGGSRQSLSSAPSELARHRKIPRTETRARVASAATGRPVWVTPLVRSTPRGPGAGAHSRRKLAWTRQAPSSRR